MAVIQKAIVLAAGLGTRLRPLTCAVPKPLMPVWGESMLARIVSLLREKGVTDIVVNCHYLHEQIEAWCAENGCTALYEPTILGTGGVLNPLREWIGNDPFYLVNGDIVVEGLESLEGLGRCAASQAGSEPQANEGERFCSSNIVGTCLVTEVGPRTIEVEPESGFVTNWKSDDAGYPGTFTYCGFAALNPEILNYVAPTGFSSIVTAYEKAMMDGKFVKAVHPKDLLWTDAGTVESYLALNRDDTDNAFADLPQLKTIGATHVDCLGARGSDRIFFKTDKGLVVLYDDAKRGENAKYAGHATWLLREGVSVPAVLLDRPDLKMTVFEWGGSEKKMSFDDSVKVIDALASFARLGEKASRELSLEPRFDATLYQWERDLFVEHCLSARYQRTLSKEGEADLLKVAAVLEKEPNALVHRDFQSTNILWKNGNLSFIDFQGMRLGPAVYDLASYVYDPYVTFSEGERRALVALYAKLSERDDLAHIVPFAAVQRLIQCLGAYGRLASVGQPQFEKYMLPALENLLTAADAAGLDALGALAEDLIACEHPHP